MKKLLSFALVAAMLLCMIPAFSVFADDADYTSIDSVEEYLEFVAAVNAGTYTKDVDHKVTVDLDFTGVDGNDVAIKQQVRDLALDFQGHTVSGIVREVTLTEHGQAGLIIDNTLNYAEILNLKIKDCKLVVNCVNENGYDPYALVGAYMGRSDRAFVNNVDLENVTIEVNGNGAVGLAYGEKAWNDWRGPNVSVKADNVVVNAPRASVGILIGRQGGVDGDSNTFTELSITDTTLVGTNEITTSTYVGTGENSVTVGEGVTPSVTLIDDATGYQCAHTNTEVTGQADATETEDGYTGDTVCKDCGETVEEGEVIPATGSGSGDSDDDNDDDDDNPATGDATVYAAILAALALAGTAVIVRKRTVSGR